jgi:hypothetical protein
MSIDTGVRPPSQRDRLVSTIVSATVARLSFVSVGMILSGVLLLLFVQRTAGHGSNLRDFASSIASESPLWVTVVVYVGAALAAALGTSRFGRGTVGDAVGSIRGVAADGSPLGT